jgi:hypothetical protein
MLAARLTKAMPCTCLPQVQGWQVKRQAPGQRSETDRHAAHGQHRQAWPQAQGHDGAAGAGALQRAGLPCFGYLKAQHTQLLATGGQLTGDSQLPPLCRSNPLLAEGHHLHAFYLFIHSITGLLDNIRHCCPVNDPHHRIRNIP